MSWEVPSYASMLDDTISRTTQLQQAINRAIAGTVLLHFLAHAPVMGEHAPLLKYRCMEVNRNIYNIGAPAFSIKSQNAFFGYRCMGQKARLYGRACHD